MKLKRFKKEENNKKIIFKIVGVFIVVGILFFAGISYAVYQRETEVTFINARVGDFRVYLDVYNEQATYDSITLDYNAYGLNPKTTCLFGTQYGNYNINPTKETNSSCTKNDLEGGMNYYYKVCARNDLNQEECKTGAIWIEFMQPTLSNINASSTRDTINLNYSSSGTRTEVTCSFGREEGNYYIQGDVYDNSKCIKNYLEIGTTYYYQVCVRNEVGEECKEGTVETLGQPLNIINIGDYISMTPTSKSYTISSSLTGASSNQTINPSELDLWRVISKNADGTVDVVSVNTSSSSITFYGGDPGYNNIVGTLNTIASQYTNTKYVIKTRHVGYSNQREICYTHDTSCDDRGYESDISVLSAIGALIAYPKGSSKINDYWLASREVILKSSKVTENFRIVQYDSVISMQAYSDSCNCNSGLSASIRPVLTLKATLGVSGNSGNAGDPYNLVTKSG